MTNLKLIGLVVIAAMGLMAFADTSTASATTLFTTSNLTTSYPAKTKFHITLASNHIFSLTDTSGNTLVSCMDSTIVWRTSTESGSPVSGGIEAWTFGNCTSTTDKVAFGSLGIEKIGANEGRVIGQGTEITTTIFSVTCTYGTGTGTNLGTITGGKAPVLSISSVGLIKTAGGFLCPSTAGLDADYIITEPHAIFIGA